MATETGRGKEAENVVRAKVVPSKFKEARKTLLKAIAIGETRTQSGSNSLKKKKKRLGSF